MPNDNFEKDYLEKRELVEALRDPLVLDALQKNQDVFKNQKIQNPLDYENIDSHEMSKLEEKWAKPEAANVPDVVRDKDDSPSFGSQLVDMPKQAGRGVVGGTLGLGESLGTFGKYLGNRMVQPIPYDQMSGPEQQEVMGIRGKYIGEGMDKDSAMNRAVNEVNLRAAKAKSGMANALIKQGDLIEKFWGEAKKPWDAPGFTQNKNVWDNPELLGSPTWWAYNIGNMAPSLAASVVPGIAAQKYIKTAGALMSLNPKHAARIAAIGGSLVGGATGGALEGTATYRSVIQQGGTEEEAARAAEFMFAFASGLNALSVGKVLSKAGNDLKGKVIKRLGAGAWEGLTEGAEEPAEVVSKLAAKLVTGEELPNNIGEMLIESLKEGLTVMPVAAVAGTGPGGMQKGMEKTKSGETARAEAKAAAEGFMKTQKERAAQDVINNTESDLEVETRWHNQLEEAVEALPDGTPEERQMKVEARALADEEMGRQQIATAEPEFGDVTIDDAKNEAINKMPPEMKEAYVEADTMVNNVDESVKKAEKDGDVKQAPAVFIQNTGIKIKKELEESGHGQILREKLAATGKYDKDQVESFLNIAYTMVAAASVKGDTRSREEIFQSYFGDVVFEGKPNTASVKMMITNADKAALKKLGYSDENINKMKPNQAEFIINNNVVKAAMPRDVEEDSIEEGPVVEYNLEYTEAVHEVLGDKVNPREVSIKIGQENPNWDADESNAMNMLNHGGYVKFTSEEHGLEKERFFTGPEWRRIMSGSAQTNREVNPKVKEEEAAPETEAEEKKRLEMLEKSAAEIFYYYTEEAPIEEVHSVLRANGRSQEEIDKLTEEKQRDFAQGNHPEIIAKIVLSKGKKLNDAEKRFAKEHPELMKNEEVSNEKRSKLSFKSHAGKEISDIITEIESNNRYRTPKTKKLSKEGIDKIAHIKEYGQYILDQADTVTDPVKRDFLLRKFKVTAKAYMFKSSKEAREKRGEVLTPPIIVNQMIDSAQRGYEEKTPGFTWATYPDLVVFEPAAGPNAPFYLESLHRKIMDGVDPIRALNSMWANELDLKNVEHIKKNTREYLDYKNMSKKDQEMVDRILDNNIVPGDMLADGFMEKFEAKQPIIPYEEGAQGPISAAEKAAKETTPEMEKLAVSGKVLFQKDGFDHVIDKGKVSNTLEDAANIITLFDGADISTLAHETGHILLGMAFDLSVNDDITDFNDAAKFVGADPKAHPNTWTDAQHEKFAKGWELYLMQGKSPSEGLRKVFENFKAWLFGIYSGIRNGKSLGDSTFVDSKGKAIKLTPEVERLFDSYMHLNAARGRKSIARTMMMAKAGYEGDVRDIVENDEAWAKIAPTINEKLKLNQSVEDDINKMFGDESGVVAEEAVEPADVIREELRNREFHQSVAEELLDSDDQQVRYNINYGNLKDVTAINRLVSWVADKYKEQINETRRDKIGDEALKVLAEDFEVTPESLTTDRIWTPEESLAMHSLLGQVSEDVINLAKEVSDDKNLLRKREVAEYELERALETQFELEAVVMKQRTETGRLFRSFQMPLDSVMSTQMKLGELADRLHSQAMMGKRATQKVAALIIEATENKSTSGKIQEVRRIQKAKRQAGKIRKGWSVFMEIYINGLLSNPITHIRNFVTNYGISMLSIPERYIGAMNGWIRKSKDKHFNADKVEATEYLEWGEANELTMGWLKGNLHAWKVMADVLPDVMTLKGMPPKYQRILRKTEHEQILGGKYGRSVGIAASNLATLPGQALEVGDLFFTEGLNGTMNTAAMAHRKAMEKKKSENLTDEQFVELRDKMTAKPENYGIDKLIKDEGEYQTFRSRLQGAPMHVQAALSKTGAGRLIVPFIRTPWNIVTYGMERTPFLHFASRRWREDWAAGGARRDLAIAKMEIAYIAGAGLVALAMNGLLTGGGPDDPVLKANLRRQGWKPYSVKTDTTYISFQNFDPVAIPVGVAAQIAELAPEMDDKTFGEMMTALAFSFMDNVVSKTYLKSLAEFMNAVQDPKRYGPRYWDMISGNLTLNVGLQRWFTRIDDPIARETKDLTVKQVRGKHKGFADTQAMIDNYKKSTPGFSKDLPPRVNFWGEAIKIDGGTPWRAISPFYKSYGKHNAPDTEFFRLQEKGINVNQSMPRDVITIDGIEIPLTAHEYNDYITLMNSVELEDGNLKQTLESVIKSRDYKELDDEEKADELNAYIKAAKDEAKYLLFEESKHASTLQSYVKNQTQENN